MKDILLQRRWLNFFGGAAYRRPDVSFEGAAVNLSPEYIDEEERQVWKAQKLSVERLLSAVLTADLTHVKRLKTPLSQFLGRHDHKVSATVAAEWLTGVKAPSKHRAVGARTEGRGAGQGAALIRPRCPSIRRARRRCRARQLQPNRLGISPEH
ncbi:hypothetical protein [Myxococcus xanthus]|uniref:hypothetical protein n=1 Tax=Myxococcus xanthus TaxID=34 RepID=UPI0034564805